MHLDTAWSGTHNVGAGPGSSNVSHDISEGNDSPGSPALSAESGKEPCGQSTFELVIYVC